VIARRPRPRESEAGDLNTILQVSQNLTLLYDVASIHIQSGDHTHDGTCELDDLMGLDNAIEL
jgi:hypothetical protein